MLEILKAIGIFVLGIIILCVVNFYIQKKRKSKMLKLGFQIKKEGDKFRIIPEEENLGQKLEDN